jgi:hypothetical protein
VFDQDPTYPIPSAGDFPGAPDAAAAAEAAAPPPRLVRVAAPG